MSKDLTASYEETPETLADEEAAFEQAYNGDDVQAPDTEVSTEATAEPAVQTQTDEPVEPADKPLTIDDLRAMIEMERSENQKVRDKLFGKIGDMQQKLETFKVQASELSPKARERLTEDFPELADILYGGVKDTPHVQEPTPVAAPVVQQSSAPTEEELEEAKEILRFDHADWETVVNSKPFEDWARTLPPAVTKRLFNTFDPAFVSGKLTLYKNWQAEQAAKVAEAAKKSTSNKDRLESAITPRGVPNVGASNMSDDDEESMMIKHYGRKT